MSAILKSELAAGSVDLWADWLREGLVASGSSQPLHRRIRAFAPLDIDPESPSLAGEIVQQIRNVAADANSAPAAAAIEVLRSWSPSLDGWEGAALLIQIAGRLGGRGLASGIQRLISHSEGLPRQAQDELAFLAIEAAAERFKRSEIAELARRLWQLDLLTPPLAAELAPLVARDDFAGLQGLPRAMVLMLPGITDESRKSEYVDAIASRLRRSYPPEDLYSALIKDQSDEPAQAMFREELLTIIAPWLLEVEPLPFTISPSTDAEVRGWTDRNIDPDEATGRSRWRFGGLGREQGDS